MTAIALCFIKVCNCKLDEIVVFFTVVFLDFLQFEFRRTPLVSTSAVSNL